MKLTKSQLREIIKEELLNESFDYKELASFYLKHGIRLKYNFPNQFANGDKFDSGFPPAVILAAEKMAPEVMKFQSKVDSTLKKLESDKMYPLYLRMTQTAGPDLNRAGYGKGAGYSLGDVKFKLSK